MGKVLVEICEASVSLMLAIFSLLLVVGISMSIVALALLPLGVLAALVKWVWGG